MTANGVRMNGHEYTHQNRFNASAEDAALEFEREMLQDGPPKNKKRPHVSASDVVGDVDQSEAKEDVAGPSVKRRKLENGMASIANGIDNGSGEPSISLRLKLKGKAKQHREPSQDSASATGTPRSRKKPGPKKRTGLALEVETELSRPASLLGDVTPSASRPSSPVPNTTMVYELDEQMPPLKKAKKVDDAILLKRIKTLEEAQKKVWTNIARRDVVKVSSMNPLFLL